MVVVPLRGFVERAGEGLPEVAFPDPVEKYLRDDGLAACRLGVGQAWSYRGVDGGCDHALRDVCESIHTSPDFVRREGGQ